MVQISQFIYSNTPTNKSTRTVDKEIPDSDQYSEIREITEL